MQSWLWLPSGSVIRWVLIGEKKVIIFICGLTHFHPPRRTDNIIELAARNDYTLQPTITRMTQLHWLREECSRDAIIKWVLNLTFLCFPLHPFVWSIMSFTLTSWYQLQAIWSSSSSSRCWERQRNFFHLHAESHVNYANFIRHQFVLIDHWLEFSIWQKIWMCSFSSRLVFWRCHSIPPPLDRCSFVCEI